MSPIPRPSFLRTKRRGFSRLATFVAIPSSAVLTVALLAVTLPWIVGSGGPQPVVAQEPEANERPGPYSPRNPPRQTSVGDAPDRLGRPGPPVEQRRATYDRPVMFRPVTETDPRTGKTHTRYVAEPIDDPFGPGRTRRIVTPEAERAAIELAQQLRRTDHEREREGLRDRLRESLSEAFDQRRERQRREIEELERQLDSLRRLDAERQERKDDIVRRRMKQLLGEPDVLDWAPPSRHDLAFPFEAPRRPETSPRRTFDAPGQPPRSEPGLPPGSPVGPGQPIQRLKADRPAPGPRNDPFGPRPGSSPESEDARTTDRRPNPDRRPGGEDETQPERPRSRGTLRAENIEIELPDGPRGKAPRTTDSRAASAERILDLTETIARLKADTHRQAASIRKTEGNEKAERWMQSRRAEIEGLQARLHLAELEWELVGRRLSDEMRLAQENRRNAVESMKRVQELFAVGDLPASELASRNSELARAEVEAVLAERRARAWTEMHKILRQRAASLTDDHDEADQDRETEQLRERETETRDGNGTEDADEDGNAEEATENAEETPDDDERDRELGDQNREARDESADTDP